MGSVVSIVYTPRDAGPRPQDHYRRESLEKATLKEFRGIVGDKKGGTGERQLNVMLAEVVAELRDEGFKTEPGELGEQIIVSGIAREALPPGARLRLGPTVIEVTIPRTGCGRFETIQGKSKKLTVGRLGVMAKVIAGGEVAVGDAVEVVPGEPAAGA
jgi:MOSC domain-containing protein YiiM